MEKSCKKLLWEALRICSLVGIVVLSACSATPLESAKVAERKTYTVAYRQYAPEPVYNRLRWVHAPEVLPARRISSQLPKKRMESVVHISIKDAPLPEALLVLANASRYNAECPDSLQSVKVSMDSLGTIDELAQELSQLSGEKIIVDHSSKIVRIEAEEEKSAVSPMLYRPHLEGAIIPLEQNAQQSLESVTTGGE